MPNEILIIDNNEIQKKAIEMVVDYFGGRAFSVKSVAEALELAGKNFQFRGIFINTAQLPVEDVFAVISFKETFPDALIVAVCDEVNLNDIKLPEYALGISTHSPKKLRIIWDALQLIEFIQRGQQAAATR